MTHRFFCFFPFQMKDMLDRMKKHKAAQKEREEMQYPYSGSDEDQPENNVAGEPSSILQAPGENTLRKNFQVLQEHKAAQQAAQQAAAQAAANGGRGGIQMPLAAGAQAPERKDRRSSRKEEVPEPGPPSRPPLPHRLVSGEAGSTPPGPPPQRPLPPPPGQMDPGAAARRDDRKPSTPPIRDQQRNSRIIQQPPQQPQRKPEDLDVLAAQLNELASSPRNQRGGRDQRASDRQRVPSQEGILNN